MKKKNGIEAHATIDLDNYQNGALGVVLIVEVDYTCHDFVDFEDYLHTTNV